MVVVYDRLSGSDALEVGSASGGLDSDSEGGDDSEPAGIDVGVGSQWQSGIVLVTPIKYV